MKYCFMTSFNRERTSERGWPGKVGRGGFDFGGMDEVAGSAGLELTFELPTAEAEAAT